MGILEDLQGKMDVLIGSLNDHTKALVEYNANQAGGGATAATDKPKTTRAKKDDKPAEAAPAHSEAELVAKFEDLKGRGGDVVPKLKKVIADQGFTSLAELRQTPTKFDSAYAALEALEAELSAPADDDDL